MDYATFDLRQQALKRTEQSIKTLLSQWVSELEPTIAYDREYRVIGISYGGQIVLWADEF